MTTMTNIDQLPEFYKRYVLKVSDMEMLEAMEHSHKNLQTLLATIPEQKGEYRYQPEKWSIKELLCHMMDAERIFVYRALRFSRFDQTELSGFDENSYAPNANAHGRTIVQLASEMKRLRESTVDLFKSFTPEMLQQMGSANGTIVSVANLGYIIPGHETHHYHILKERYLN